VALQWGNVPDWAAAIGTVGTLVGTLMVIRQDHKKQADAERWDEALLVDGSVVPVTSRWFPNEDGTSGTAIGVSVTNNGRRPIEAVTMTVIDPAGETIDERLVGSVPARAMEQFEIESRPGLWAGQGLSVTWRVVFRDSASWVWTLSSDRQLHPTTPGRGRRPGVRR
jgi:hypothetical protein